METQSYKISLLLYNGNSLNIVNGNSKDFNTIANIYNLLSTLLDRNIINRKKVKEVILDKIN